MRSPFLISSIIYWAPDNSFIILSTCPEFSSSIFCPAFPTNLAVIGFFSPLTLRMASIVQYSFGINAFISSSLSHIILNATDCTRPAESPRLTFAQSKGLILYPTILSRTLLDCCASTRFILILRGSLIDALTAFLVISLKLILLISLSSILSACARCHDMASPSRSGSVARYILSDFLTSFLKLARTSPLPLMVIYLGS